MELIACFTDSRSSCGQGKCICYNKFGLLGSNSDVKGTFKFEFTYSSQYYPSSALVLEIVPARNLWDASLA